MPRKNKPIEPIVLYLIQERLRNRMTQKQIADLANIPLRTYQRIEQGKSEATISQVRRVIEVFDITWLDVAWGETGRRYIDTNDISASLKHLPASLRLPLFEVIKAVIEELDQTKRPTTDG
ncbi:helix-turn-helix domain-containing protein [Vibrio diabolicus]|uniref:helix-turn-helix transcriptional regulator n=1 Tax=Vibrio diabolicus TaxID=50719 RepID=UPI00211AEB83|nr:helix-turn-helix transcriptional regulator [Vibrio diabolicus]HCG8683760.1 helix-turn-helix transcriptional regulator [Vibrio parahaemolyticus]MCG9228072.1 helix-turn-helix domain-containing protein [Vibrio diabolicus]MCG9569914.1 helix-turn-helix domain-containing protein [Vibrio diabolicus]MCG9593385.1 helix-turn-helix domain-containing protein [Vibrio diabolicus]MCG9775982.1 helix-turn-helix domain-containing protein [Vibrio diabolicus]